ncbi:nucleoside-diphosphate sugar epimerase [Wenzhouxiangella sediminis]|uniref:Nucleoside-diphosphate sugar epimerase n=1 Tax=Wenzhouxiangella sediminis TaxID=1792836 RepID=A0A3E1K4Q5_9GAMM|nr:nucleoside-diphosphate sugar epimerase [Wenzhouxiangella sediminis]RFF29047.1 nucleoside-diphosphate sugar epimerase [Wenzhouxiangella sediminis]
MSEAAIILLLGASGPVGQCFLDRTAGQRIRVIAISRRDPEKAWPHVTWLQHDLERGPGDVRAGTLVSFGPLAHALSQVEQGIGLGRVIALSSASTLFKKNSRDRAERRQMAALAQCEEALERACRERDIVLTLLKPTLIYGGGQDANVSRIAGLVSRLPLVPVAGRGLRAPVHADDLARLAVECVISGPRSAGTWLLAGGETLTYPDMLKRVAAAEGRHVRLLRLPAWLMKPAVRAAHLAGRMTDIKPAMIERQGMDLVVDDTPAREQLGWDPRPFRP